MRLVAIVVALGAVLAIAAMALHFLGKSAEARGCDQSASPGGYSTELLMKADEAARAVTTGRIVSSIKETQEVEDGRPKVFKTVYDTHFATPASGYQPGSFGTLTAWDGKTSDYFREASGNHEVFLRDSQGNWQFQRRSASASSDYDYVQPKWSCSPTEVKQLSDKDGVLTFKLVYESQ